MEAPVTNATTDTRPTLPNPYWKYVNLCLAVVLGGLGWGLIALIVALRSRNTDSLNVMPVAFLVYGGLVAGILGLAMPIGYFATRSDARRVDALREAIAAGKYLCRWKYSAQTWSAFHQAVRERDYSRRRMADLGFIIFGILGLATILATFVFGGSMEVAAVFAMRLVGGAVCITVAVLAVVYRLRLRARQERSQTPCDTFVTPGGIWANHHWILWGTASRELQAVQLTDTSAGHTVGSGLLLKIDIRSGEATVEELVCIPSEHRALAERLVTLLLTSPMAKKGGSVNTLSAVLRDLHTLLR